MKIQYTTKFSKIFFAEDFFCTFVPEKIRIIVNVFI